MSEVTVTKFPVNFIEQQREIANSATQRPWMWENGRKCYLFTPKNGKCIVMDFVRKGMHDAQPRFSDRGNKPLGGILYPASELNLDTHPDARYIVEAANNYPDALDEIENMRARIAELTTERLKLVLKIEDMIDFLDQAGIRAYYELSVGRK